MMTAAVASRHRAWIDIDHVALVANLAALRHLAGAAEIIAVVKANAYGHGAVEVAQTLSERGSERLAVATLSEAVELRNHGLVGPMVLLWGIGEGDGEQVAATGVEPIVTSALDVGWLEAAADAANRRIGVHLKIDTGLGRQGIEPALAVDLATRISASRHLALVGTMTHLAAAGEDVAHCDLQLQRMADVLDGLHSHAIDPGLVHIGGTGAILAGAGGFADAVRPGIGLYGLAPDWADATAAGLMPVLSLRALPLRIFEVAAGTPIGYGMRWQAPSAARLATLPIGYGDGWPRIHLNNGVALVRGQRVPMVGAISMDGLVVDVSGVDSVSLDDEFVLIGRQGNQEITADEVAVQRGTINYEVTTMLRSRLPRRHGRP
ncbi:MAG: alanine racemase [Candidatus Limnocylindria bacterium]